MAPICSRSTRRIVKETPYHAEIVQIFSKQVRGSTSRSRHSITVHFPTRVARGSPRTQSTWRSGLAPPAPADLVSQKMATGNADLNDSHQMLAMTPSASSRLCGAEGETGVNERWLPGRTRRILVYCRCFRSARIHAARLDVKAEFPLVFSPSERRWRCANERLSLRRGHQGQPSRPQQISMDGTTSSASACSIRTPAAGRAFPARLSARIAQPIYQQHWRASPSFGRQVISRRHSRAIVGGQGQISGVQRPMHMIWRPDRAAPCPRRSRARGTHDPRHSRGRCDPGRPVLGHGGFRGGRDDGHHLRFGSMQHRVIANLA